ncbi:FtsX-like permease family protein [Niastella caeni]|uniref:FtsX-like permease family protein n=1 Tax=Niastella caeni TaxID=2569763 RepID=A0A4V4H024_9BACT|nr:ABC transporter permease [Niastella caeni]THU34846.1 FtsX-like permease family protein [Niastella caeni]
MLRNYFKIAWRSLLQNKGLAFINIFGLAIGMAFALLIGLWIQYETSFDTFHVNKDRIGLIRKHTLFNNQKSTSNNQPLPLYDELKRNYPEIKRLSRIDNDEYSLIVGNNKFKKSGTYVDPDFLTMLSFPIVKGNAATALNDPNAIVLTESLANTLFGKEDPIGKSIKLDNLYTVQVTAIAKDVPDNSTLQFEFLAPFEFQLRNSERVRNAQWGNNFLTYLVEMKEGSSMQALSKKIEPLIMQKRKDKITQLLFLQPLQQWHLYNDYKDWVNTGGRIEYVRLFSIIGIFVLLIACINFMNLSTARSEKRAKEVGIRKSVGSQRIQLIVQFLSESLLTAFLAFLCSIILIQLLLPLLKDIGFEKVHFRFGDVSLWASLLGVCILTGLIAGSYPAFYLSSFTPIKVLKGTIKQGIAAVSFRKVLVVLQFTISIGLIVCTVIVFQQINHAKDRHLGYNPNNLITIPSSNDLNKNYEPWKQEVLNTGYVESIAQASSPMTRINNSWSDFTWQGKNPNAITSFDVVMTDWDYDKTAGLKILKGRSFSREYKTDSNAILINEAAEKLIGYNDPLGKVVSLGTEPLTVIGVVENVVMRDPFKPVSPTIILFNVSRTSNMLLRLASSADLTKALAAIQPITEKYNPSLPFEYNFVDEEFGKKFMIENQVGKLAGILAGLAIFISCLGLFGLAAFMAERRIKEIGIRKVLGASVANLWMLLSKEFVLLVLLAGLIASPLALWLMQDWLQKYDYRIAINGWVFAFAGLLAVMIALFTVSAQAVKAALANPVKSLRTE